MRNKNRILFMIPLPPPIHGAAMMGEYLRTSPQFTAQFDCTFINTLLTRDLRDKNRCFAKVCRYASMWFKIICCCLFHRYDLCCLAITCYGVGFLKDVPLALFCKLLRQPLVLYHHNTGMAGYAARPIYRTLYRLVYGNTPVILLSKRLWKDVAAHVPSEHIIICPNGIPDEAPGVQPVAVQNKPPRLLFLSNLLIEKGVQTFLDMLLLLHRRGVAFSADIVGAPTAEIRVEQIRDFLTKNDLSKQVAMHGPLFGAAKREQQKLCDLFVFPSSREAFGLVLLEAMMYAKPCIACEVGGVPDIVKDGETGLICPPHDAETLADTVSRLLAAPELCQQMGRAGRRRFETYFTRIRYESNFATALRKAIDFYHRQHIPEMRQRQPVPQTARNIMKSLLTKFMMVSTMVEEPFSGQKRHPFWMLTALFVGALFLRIVGYIFEPILSRDGIVYVELIQKWYDSENFSLVFQGDYYWIPPFFLYLTKSLMYLGFQPEQAAIILNISIGAAIPILAYFIILEWSHDRWIAWWSAICLGLHPLLIELSYMVQRENVYLFFLLLSLLFFLYARRARGWHWSLVTGVTLSLAALTRFEALEFIVMYPFLLLIVWVGRQGGGYNIVQNMAALIGGGLIGVGGAILLMRVPLSFFVAYWERFCFLMDKF